MEETMNFKQQVMATTIPVVVLAATSIVGITIGNAQNADPSRVEVASNSVRANGCHDTSQRFATTVPNVDQLDRNFHGILDGIEIVETEANNGHAIRNVTWSGPNTVSYELYAKGAGNWIDPPKILGVTIGGGVCVGAAGASEGVAVYAHYKQLPVPKGS